VSEWQDLSWDCSEETQSHTILWVTQKKHNPTQSYGWHPMNILTPFVVPDSTCGIVASLHWHRGIVAPTRRYLALTLTTRLFQQQKWTHLQRVIDEYKEQVAYIMKINWFTDVLIYKWSSTSSRRRSRISCKLIGLLMYLFVWEGDRGGSTLIHGERGERVCEVSIRQHMSA
jgi:hypothetical protein